MGQTPLIGSIKQPVKQKLATLHRPLNPVPAPSQMDNKGQDSTR
jgi:hypothetical protein